MRKYFRELEVLFQNPKSILTYIDKIEALRENITEPLAVTEFVNKVREKVQNEAIQAVIDNNGGMVAMATGSGKSRVAVELAKYHCEPFKSDLALLVPTEKIREIQEIYRTLYQKNYNTTQAVGIIEAEMEATPERDEIIDFIRNSSRGIMKGYSGNF